MKPDLLTLPMADNAVMAEAGFKKLLRLESHAKAVGGDVRRPESPAGSASEFRSPAPGVGAILLMSHDAGLGRSLRDAAGVGGRTVVRVEEVAETFRALRAIHPAAVLLDLDLPTGAAWEAADRLLQEASCSPVILLTARTGQFDFRMAIRTGAVVDKATDPERLWQIVEQALASPHPPQAERNAMQHVVIHWLKPSRWSVPLTTPAYREWGIND